MEINLNIRDKLGQSFDLATLEEIKTFFDAEKNVLVKPRRTLLSENFHTPMDSFHCWLYEAV